MKTFQMDSNLLHIYKNATSYKARNTQNSGTQIIFIRLYLEFIKAHAMVMFN